MSMESFYFFRFSKLLITGAEFAEEMGKEGKRANQCKALSCGTDDTSTAIERNK